MPNYFDLSIEQMREAGIGFEVGLSDTEIDAVESRFGFRFPPDLRLFLQTALPVSLPAEPVEPDEDEEFVLSPLSPFPNWRSGDEAELRERLDAPAEGICFDIEYNRFWHPPWGARPDAIEAACTLAREHIRQAPTLIPVFGHRYLPDFPRAAGNPVFSVVQTDIIYYGYDLPHYLAREFDITNPCLEPSQPRRIDFWASLPFLWNPDWN